MMNANKNEPRRPAETDLWRTLRDKKNLRQRRLNELFDAYGVSMADRNMMKQLSCQVRTLKNLMESEGYKN